MIVRNATEKDIDRILHLLLQVNNVHAEGRPDIFKKDMRKYTRDEVASILESKHTCIYVADENGVCVGYAFCEYSEIEDGTNLVPRKTVYIDDICVDSLCRGKGVGTLLYNHVENEAKKKGCYNITLNVWSFNDSAMRFYEKCGMSPLKTVMEKIIK